MEYCHFPQKACQWWFTIYPPTLHMTPRESRKSRTHVSMQVKVRQSRLGVSPWSIASSWSTHTCPVHNTICTISSIVSTSHIGSDVKSDGSTCTYTIKDPSVILSRRSLRVTMGESEIASFTTKPNLVAPVDQVILCSIDTREEATNRTPLY